MHDLNFVIMYPIFMSIFWSIGAIIHYFSQERTFTRTFNEECLVSILVPCYNEEDNIEEIIYRLGAMNYRNYEIIAIDDGSSDLTGEKLKAIAKNNSKLRVVISEQNRGKANALHLGLLASKGKYLVCVDADAYLDPEAINYMIPYFLSENNGQRVGAVTGNPQVRNRNSLLGKIQTAEFSSIVGSIKRAQRVGRVAMTVSGVVVAFSREALLDVGLWDKDMITEDIAVTWKLHRNNWEIVYEPRAICWMLVPEKISGLWKQRVRWSQGGVEVLFRHFTDTLKNGRLTSVLLVEQILGIIWSYLWLISVIKVIFFQYPVKHFWFQNMFLELVCLCQFTIAMLISSKHDHSLRNEFIWIIWYPLVYWYFNALVIAYAFIKTVFQKKQKFATWTSPDRGDLNREEISLNENIAQTIDLNDNLITSYKSSFIYTAEIVITVILWFIFLANVLSLIRFISFKILILNIPIVNIITQSDYYVYLQFYIDSFIVCCILLFCLYILGFVRKRISNENVNIDEEIIEYFKITNQELLTIRTTKVQSLNNLEFEKRKREESKYEESGSISSNVGVTIRGI